MSLFARMCLDLNVPPSWVRKVIARAPFSYKLYNIPKKGGGVRPIAQPSKDVKLLQAWLVNNVFCELPVHESAYAYRKNISILDNAKAHAKNRYIAKFDFSGFFSSIDGDSFRQHLDSKLAGRLTADDIHDIIRICFRRDAASAKYILSIGAPSSPQISNSIMYDFDEMVCGVCRASGIVYTRYADDITFSTNKEGVLFDSEKLILKTLKKISYPSLKINAEKTVFSSKKYRRRVTGLILTNDNQVSLGRDRKRYISSQVHKFMLAKLSPDAIGNLRGLLAFSQGVEPEFISRLEKKYGEEIVREIIHG